jgi:hypothetical protein
VLLGVGAGQLGAQRLHAGGQPLRAPVGHHQQLQRAAGGGLVVGVLVGEQLDVGRVGITGGGLLGADSMLLS